MERVIKRIWSALMPLRKEEQHPVFGVLLIGRTGTGRSTLINNLVGREVAEEVHTIASVTSTISKHMVEVEGVPIALYDTPGLCDTRGDFDEQYLHQMKCVLDSGDIYLVICCTKMSETRLSSSLVYTYQEFHKIGVKWEKVLLAFTFADVIPVPKPERRKPGFDIVCYFNSHLAKLRADIAQALVEKVGVAPEVANRIKCMPTTIDPDETLLNGEQWFVPFWLAVLELLSPSAVKHFQEKHTINGRYLNSKEVESFSTAPPFANPPAVNPTPVPTVFRKAVTPPKQPDRRLARFTESECHTLYQKAITSGPTITLNIAKAMTIGPPRVGKTSVRHLLLGLPQPEVSISTPVMKTAETVGILSSDETASSGEIKLPRAVKADSDLVHIQSEDEWVVVNQTSGILSLLSHLNKEVEKAKSGARIQKNAVAQMQSQVEHVDSVPTAMEMIKPQEHLHMIHADSKSTGSQPESIEQPLPTSSTSARIEDSTQVLAAAHQLHQLLQTPDIANITLPDAKLLQFLDCGGQLAFHDILPIFTTIPAIYLHVFDLTRGLADRPRDQLCLDMSEGEIYSQAQSPLTVAEMMSQSVMTIESLADKRVRLPEGVLLSEPPRSRIVFVGTHLDELAQKHEDMMPAFNSTSKDLQSALQVKSHSLEEKVMKNQDDRLPAMFFPVTCKQSVSSDIGIRAIQQLKKRIRALVSDVKVKVPVKWYLYQMLEMSRSKEERTPVHEYRDLYKTCHLTKVVNDLKEFHTMITYFHALGLLIHACNDDAGTHSEDSTCLVFTDPSYLFENISKLFHVQFLDEIRCEGTLLNLKRQGRLTKETLRDLKVDSTQLDYEAFMDVLIHFFIGAEIEDSVGNEDRTLFIPSVLPVNGTLQPVTTEQSCHFVIAFSKKPFVPCGVYAGTIARLCHIRSLPQWTISTSPMFMSCSHASFGVGAEDKVDVFNCSSHIRVKLSSCAGHKAQEYRDTVLNTVAESYCFLFHGQCAKDQTCATCRDDPYLVLGLTCHPCHERKTKHIATLQVEHGEAKAVRCPATQDTRRLHDNHLELFQSIQHYAVVHNQHTSPTFSRKVKMALPPSDTAGDTAEEAALLQFKDFAERFIREVQSRDNPAFIAKLHRHKVIPERIRNKIAAASDNESANSLLFDFLHEQATGESLCKLLVAMIEAEGYPAMNQLGREMKTTLGL